MQLHAGTVIGGVVERSFPLTPLWASALRLGISSRHASSAHCGVKQSNPIITKRFIALLSTVFLGEQLCHFRPRELHRR